MPPESPGRPPRRLPRRLSRRPHPRARARLGPSLPPWLGRLGTSALQGCGLLGTSHLLDALARLVPGHAASRLALHPAIGVGVGAGAGISQSGAGVGVGVGSVVVPTIAAAILVAMLVATVEEILFRGLVFEGLRRRVNLRTAVLGSALLFGLAHLDLHQGVAAALLGVQLGALRAILGLPLAIFAHALNNTAVVLARAGGLETSAATLALAALLSITALHSLTRRARVARSVLQRAPGSDEPSGGNGHPGPATRHRPETVGRRQPVSGDGDERRDERADERRVGGSEHPAGR